MIGKKPATTKGFNIVRGFRGEMLYLVSVHNGNGFRWERCGKSDAMLIGDAQDALALAERASREWGAKCTVVDTAPAPHVVAKADAPAAPRGAYPRAATRMTNCSHGATLGTDCRECRADGVQS